MGLISFSLLSWSVGFTLCFLILLLPEAKADNLNTSTSRNGGGSQCGEYTNQLMEDGMCRLVATLPQLDERRCPDMFRCSDEVSYWLHENEERKQQIVALKETISELQEELRNHRHRIKVLELQSEEKLHLNISLEQRFHELEVHYAEASSLLHLQGTLILDLQNQLHNLTLLMDKVKRSSDCSINIVRPNHLQNTQEALHPEIQHMGNCPIDCASIYYNGVRRSGLYTVVPLLASMPVEVYCDMDTDGGGWTVIQRRVDGSVSFDRSWRDYRDGFGDLHSEFWLGNNHIHELSTQGDYSLRIDLEDWSIQHKHALYQSFSVEDEEHQYRLHVSGFSGTVQDSFGWYHDKQHFSTPDTGNICAEISHGGWWYNQCFYANLNGVYYRGGHYTPKGRGSLGPDGIVWYSWKDSDYYSLRKVSMMIRPRSFHTRGGWTVIQRRVDGSVSFDRSWRDYRDGFGDLHSEFWLGNNHIHELSTQGDYSLRIDLEDWSIQHKHALYQSFSVEDEEHQYRLHVSGFSGTVQDSFGWYHDKQHFSTPDTGNICAEISHGGWWYNQCFYANLNGVYYRGGHYTPKGRGSLGPDGIVWYSWKDSDYYSLRKVSMMIRPRSFHTRLSP